MPTPGRIPPWAPRLGGGWLVKNGVGSRKGWVVSESGIKLRFDLLRTPLRFLKKLGTTFWGLRAGIQFRGVWSFNDIGYVFEFGAGSW